MKTRIEEVEILLAENMKQINSWLWKNHFDKEPPPPEMRKLIDEKVRLEVELHDLTGHYVP